MEIIRYMPEKEYRKAEGLSKSDIDKIAQSPQHYHFHKHNSQEPTQAMRIGTALHAYVLEDFDKLCAVEPTQINKRTKDGKEIYEVFQTLNANKTIITEDDMEHVKAMSASIMAHPTASHLIKTAEEKELSVFFEHECGTKAKCRPDIIANGGVLVDIKTTTDASPDAFSKALYNFRYFVQSAYYLDGTKELTGNGADFIFIVVEKIPPYAVAVYIIGDADIDLGRQDYKRHLETYNECVKTGIWHGYSQQIQDIFLPDWVHRKAI